MEKYMGWFWNDFLQTVCFCNRTVREPSDVTMFPDHLDGDLALKSPKKATKWEFNCSNPFSIFFKLRNKIIKPLSFWLGKPYTTAT